jgi:hypothetical protein
MSQWGNFASASALFGEPGPCIVLAITVVVIGVVAVRVVEKIAASKPTIEWTSKRGPTVKVTFPSKSRRK